MTNAENQRCATGQRHAFNLVTVKTSCSQKRDFIKTGQKRRQSLF